MQKMPRESGAKRDWINPGLRVELKNEFGPKTSHDQSVSGINRYAAGVFSNFSHFFIIDLDSIVI